MLIGFSILIGLKNNICLPLLSIITGILGLYLSEYYLFYIWYTCLFKYIFALFNIKQGVLSSYLALLF